MGWVEFRPSWNPNKILVLGFDLGIFGPEIRFFLFWPTHDGSGCTTRVSGWNPRTQVCIFFLTSPHPDSPSLLSHHTLSSPLLSSPLISVSLSLFLYLCIFLQISLLRYIFLLISLSIFVSLLEFFLRNFIRVYISIFELNPLIVSSAHHPMLCWFDKILLIFFYYHPLNSSWCKKHSK